MKTVSKLSNKLSKTINKPRSKEDITKEYQLVAAALGNLVISFEVQKTEHMKKFISLSKELELVSAIEVPVEA